jgi:hypothetical protein
VEGQPGFEHEGDPIARLDPLRVEPLCKLRRTGGYNVKTKDFIDTIRVRDPHRRPARTIGVAGDAFVRDVEAVAVSIKQIPQRIT